VFAVLAIIAGALGWWGLDRRTEAIKQRTAAQEAARKAETSAVAAKQAADAARTERRTAQITQSRFLASLSRQETDRGDAVTGALLSLEGLPQRIDDPEDRPLVGEAVAALYSALSEAREREDLRHEHLVWSAAFSADGTTVVTASYDNTARLWEVASGKELAVLRGHENSVISAAFSADGTKVVTASTDNTARLWEIASGKELAVLRGHESWVYSAAFSADGTKVVTASEDKTARLWRVFPLGQALVNDARLVLPRQLTREQKAKYFLDAASSPAN
jgi:WD40 repeat protein